MIVADLDTVPPKLDGQFDLIVYGDILEHLKRPEKVLSELNRYLRPTGKIIVSVPNFVHLFVRLNILIGRFEYMERGILDRTHLRFFTLKTFRKFLANAGLSVEELAVTPVPLLLVVPADRPTARVVARRLGDHGRAAVDHDRRRAGGDRIGVLQPQCAAVHRPCAGVAVARPGKV